MNTFVSRSRFGWFNTAAQARRDVLASIVVVLALVLPIESRCMQDRLALRRQLAARIGSSIKLAVKDI